MIKIPKTVEVVFNEDITAATIYITINGKLREVYISSDTPQTLLKNISDFVRDKKLQKIYIEILEF